MENKESGNTQIIQPEVLKSILDMENEKLLSGFLMESVKNFVSRSEPNLDIEQSATILISDLEVAFNNNSLGMLVRVLEQLKQTAESSFGYSGYYSSLYTPKASKTPEDIQRIWLSTLGVLKNCHYYFADKLARINSRTNYFN